LFVENEQAWLWAGEQLPCGLLVLPDMLPLFLLLFFWVGELFLTHTWTCNERNHKCQTEGHPQPNLQATLITCVEADTKVCKEATCQAKQAAHKAVVHQPTARPVHFLQTKHHLCLNQPNIAVKITSIMKEQDPSPQGICGSLLLTACRAVAPEIGCHRGFVVM